MQFLETLGGRWNISLFHYRNHGADFGRVLAAFEVPAARSRTSRPSCVAWAIRSRGRRAIPRTSSVLGRRQRGREDNASGKSEERNRPICEVSLLLEDSERRRRTGSRDGSCSPPRAF